MLSKIRRFGPPDFEALSRYLKMKLMYIYLLLLITFFNEFWYFTMLPGMPSKISYQSVLKRFFYYVPKKSIRNLDDLNLVWIYLWTKNRILCTFRCTGDHQLGNCPSWSFVPYPSTFQTAGTHSRWKHFYYVLSAPYRASISIHLVGSTLHSLTYICWPKLFQQLRSTPSLLLWSFYCCNLSPWKPS